jgi:Tfp pilus assembly protein PilF
MRVTAISAALALMVLSVSTSLMAQRPDAQIDPKSLALVQEGRAAQAAGDLEGANDLLESALAVDPRNREAFVLLAEIARTRNLPGKAIRLYREALLLEPNDLAALRGQGEAMVAKGAIEKAKGNLAKIKTICAAGCNDANVLAAAITKGPPVTVTAAAEKPATPAKP